MWKQIESPSLIIDEERVKKNIKKMADKATRLGLTFRPHFKTHQSATIGNWFKEFGVDKIAVSSLYMAEYFANHDWDDILWAFPVNIREIRRINQLSSKINLGIIVENTESATFLLQKLKHPVEVWLKIDAGYHRTGLEAADSLKLEEILQIIAHSKFMILKGLVSHSGNTYDAESTKEIQSIHQKTLTTLSAIKEKLIGRYPKLKISLGDTPSCSICENFSGTDEFRPGVFVFYDWMQYKIGACSSDEIAIVIALPIVAKHKKRNEIVVHGGAVHLSKDRLEHNGKVFFGQAIRLDTWQVIEEVYVKKLSQEHGIIHLPDHLWEAYQVGELIGVIPVHACLTADMHSHYFTRNGEMLLKLSR